MLADADTRLDRPWLHLDRTPDAARGAGVDGAEIEGRYLEPGVDLARAASESAQLAVREYRDLNAGNVLTLEVSRQRPDTAIVGMEILRQ